MLEYDITYNIRLNYQSYISTQSTLNINIKTVAKLWQTQVEHWNIANVSYKECLYNTYNFIHFDRQIYVSKYENVYELNHQY